MHTGIDRCTNRAKRKQTKLIVRRQKTGHKHDQDIRHEMLAGYDRG